VLDKYILSILVNNVRFCEYLLIQQLSKLYGKVGMIETDDPATVTVLYTINFQESFDIDV